MLFLTSGVIYYTALEISSAIEKFEPSKKKAISDETLEVLVTLDNLGCAWAWDLHARLAKCIFGSEEILGHSGN